MPKLVKLKKFILDKSKRLALNYFKTMALFFHEKIREIAIWRKRTLVSWFMVRCDTQWILLSNLEFFPRVEYSLLKAPLRHFNPHGIHPEQILFHFICLLLGFTEENWFNPICLYLMTQSCFAKRDWKTDCWKSNQNVVTHD